MAVWLDGVSGCLCPCVWFESRSVRLESLSLSVCVSGMRLCVYVCLFGCLSVGVFASLSLCMAAGVSVVSVCPLFSLSVGVA